MPTTLKAFEFDRTNKNIMPFNRFHFKSSIKLRLMITVCLMKMSQWRDKTKLSHSHVVRRLDSSQPA